MKNKEKYIPSHIAAVSVTAACAFLFTMTGAMVMSCTNAAGDGNMVFAAETSSEAATDNSSSDAAAKYENLVSDAFNISCTCNCLGTPYECTFAIPQINVNSAEIDALNKQIYDKYYAYYESANQEYTEDLECCEVSYHWGVADDKLSLTIIAYLYPDSSGWDEPEVFTVNLSDGTVMTQDQLKEYFGFTDDTLFAVEKDALGNKFGTVYPDRLTTIDMSTSFNYGQYTKTISDDNVKACTLYMTEEGHPGIYAEIYSLAGGDQYPFLIDLATYENSAWYAQQGGTTVHYDGSAEDANVIRGKSFNSDYEYEGTTANAAASTDSGSASASSNASSNAASGTSSGTSSDGTQSLGTYTVKVDSGYLALRNAMAFDSANEIGSLYTGETVEVIEKTSSDYWYVYSSKYDAYGYVNCNYLVSNGSSSGGSSSGSGGSGSGSSASGSGSSSSGSGSSSSGSGSSSSGGYSTDDIFEINGRCGKVIN